MSFIKDNIPFIFFMISGYILMFHQGWLYVFSSAMFYGVGSIMLVTRSAVQRLDLESTRKIHHHFPEVVYEYGPYWCGATAVFMMLAFKLEIVQFGAFLLLIYALRNLLLRHNHRCKKPGKF